MKTQETSAVMTLRDCEIEMLKLNLKETEALVQEYAELCLRWFDKIQRLELEIKALRELNQSHLI